MDTIRLQKGTTQMVAHAALQGLETQNTLAGVIAAGNRSHWGIEVDVRITKDGEAVLIHNSSTLAVSGVDMEVADSTLEELQSLRLYDSPMFYGMEAYGLKQEFTVTRSDLRIPTFEEYIRICKHYGKIAVVELKSRMTPENITHILDIVRAHDYLERVVFIDFCWEDLEEVRRQSPGQTVQFLTGEKHDFTDEFLDKVAAAGFDLDIHIFTTTKELVERIHSRGIKVNVWTCDHIDRAAKLVEWGVDYITSNILE
jgi:glycerophosphoryl diester phosphodiesterase